MYKNIPNINGSINDLDISVSTHNTLMSHGIKIISQLISMTEDDIETVIPLISIKTMRDIKEALNNIGLSLKVQTSSARIQLLINKGYFTKEDLIAYLNKQ